MIPVENETRPFVRSKEFLLVLLLTLASLLVRVHQIGFYSLSEDETAKWEAIQQYRHGHFAGVNAEHPMLMKLMAWASLDAGDQWNRRAFAHGWPVISPEAALRLPNAILGAATTFVLFLLARAFFGAVGAFAAASFWAFTPLPIALNRLLKEETPFVFFSLLACYFYLRAKKSQTEPGTRSWLDFSAITFGLAFASKYALQFFGLNALAWYIAGRTGLDSKPFGHRLARFFLILGLTFVLANPVILVPSNLHSMAAWMREGGIQHSGYNLHGTLYLNQPSFSRPTMPWYFYLWLLVVKTPLVSLAAILAGSLLLLRSRNSLTAAFFVSLALIQLTGLSVFPAKWIRYVLGALPFLFIAGGQAVQCLYDWLTTHGIAPRRLSFAAMLLVGWMLWDARAWGPFYSLYLNPLGGGSKKVAQLFSPDEISELDSRETAAVVCQSAPPGGRLATSKPSSMNYYLERCGRKDIQVIPLYDRRYRLQEGDLVLWENSRRYFETAEFLESLRSSRMPHHDIRVGPVVATSIYSFPAIPSDVRRASSNISLSANNTVAPEYLSRQALRSLGTNAQSVTWDKETHQQ